MTDGIRIRRLGVGDTDQYVALRREMLVDTPAAFLGTPEDDDCLDFDIMEERLSQGENAVFGAEDENGTLVSVAGIYRQPRAKTRHRAMIWGVYTTPDARGRGLSTRVLEAVLDHARSLGGLEVVQLSVSADTPNAQRVYERVGFEAWGREPRSVMLGDGRVDEIHMWRAL